MLLRRPVASTYNAVVRRRLARTRTLIWLIVAAFAGIAVVGVSAWARSERQKADAEGAARRERNQLDLEEAKLLAKLRDRKD